MATKKHVKLADMLVNETENGSLDWREGTLPDSYQLSLKNSSIVIYKVASKTSDAPDIIVDVINGEGVVVDSFSDVELYQLTNTAWYEKMGELYDIARRTALGSDRLIDEILTELEDAAFRNIFK